MPLRAVLREHPAAAFAGCSPSVTAAFRAGGRAGQPLTAGVLLRQLHEFCVPVTQTLTAAFRQLVLQAPAPVVAKALGYTTGLRQNTSQPAAAHGADTQLPLSGLARMLAVACVLLAPGLT
jgi:hypothetical protein